MATHKMTTHDLGAMIKSIGTYAQEAQKQAVFNAALYMKKEIETQIRKDLGGKDYFRQMVEKKTKTGNFVGVRPQTNRVGVKFDVKGENNPTALLTAYGPFGLLEYGAFRHEIIAKNPELAAMKRGAKKKRVMAARYEAITAGKRGAFSGSLPLRTPYGPRYRIPMHPGAKGKQSFSKAVAKATPKASNMATSLIQSKVIQRLRTQAGTVTYVVGESGAFRPVVG